MSREQYLRGIAPPVIGVLLLVLAGCGDRSSHSAGVSVDDYARIRAMTSFYEAYRNEHGNQPPPDEQAFRDYLGTKDENLQQAGMTVGDMFASPRSGSAIEWVYGRTPPRDQAGMTWLAYEIQPKDGKRLVIGTRGTFEEMDDARFQSLFPNT